MRCEVHPESDAIGQCSRCSRALCPECAVRHMSALHCKSCLSLATEQPAAPAAAASQIAPPPATAPVAGASYYQPPAPSAPATPQPRGRPATWPFAVGSVGALGGGISFMLSAPFGGFGFFGSIYGGYSSYVGYGYYVLPVILAVVMASLQTMYAIGLYGFYRNYGSPTSLAGAIALVAGAWISAAVFVIIGLSPTCIDECIGPAPPSYYSYAFLSAAYSVPIGIGVIIAGLGVHNAARFHPDIKAMRNVGVFLTTGGLILAVVCLAFVGWAMAGVAEIVSLMLFRTALVPSGSTVVAASSMSSVTSPPSSSPSSK